MDSSLSLSALFPDFQGLLSGSADSLETFSGILVIGLIISTLGLSLFALLKYYQGVVKIKFYLHLIDHVNLEDFAEKRRDVLKQATASKSHGSLWQSYNSSLHEEQNPAIVYRMIPTSNFFSPRSLGLGLVENRLLLAAPGWLTAVGVIGTFSGLLLGLSELSLSDSSVEELKAAVLAMISGASVAFITSLWGLICSLSFSIFEKYLDRGLRKRVRILVTEINSLSLTVNPEKNLTLIEKGQTEGNKILSGLAEQIGNHLQETLQEGQQDLLKMVANSLNDVLEPAIQSLVKNAQDAPMKQLETLIQRFVKNVSAAGQVQSENIAKMTEQFTKVSERLGLQMNDMAVTVKEVQEQILQQNNQQQITFEKQNLIVNQQIQSTIKEQKSSGEMVSAQIEGVETALNQTVKNSEALARGLEGAASELKDVSDVVKTSMLHFSKQVENATLAQKKISQQVSEAHQQMQSGLKTQEQSSIHLTEAVAHLDQGTGAIKKLFDVGLSSLEQLTTNLTRQVTELEDQQRLVLKSYGEQVSEQVKERINLWAEQTIEVHNIQMDAIKAFNSLIDEMETRIGDSLQRLSLLSSEKNNVSAA